MTPVADAAVRIRALDPRRSFIVQAPAGSGKTELLTQRLLVLLATVQRPDEILAITFTRKAAAEMRTRLLRTLERAADPPPSADHERRTWELARQVLARDDECGWRLLENPSLLAIQTIDSFNASLVRRMPWSSRFGGMPEIADDPSRLYREAARRTLARLGSGGEGSEAAARLLTHLDNRMEQLQEMLMAMLQRRDQWLRHLVGTDHAAHRRELEGALERYIDETLSSLRERIPTALQSALLESGRYAAGNIEGERPLAILDGLTAFPAATAADLPAWKGLSDLLLTAGGDLRRKLDRNCGFPPGKNGREGEMKEAMSALLAEPALVAAVPLLREIRRLPPSTFPDGQWQVLAALVDLLRLAAQELWLVFREEGKVDFAEIAGQALRALREDAAPSDLLLRLDATLSHILVDEFQDTSRMQFALLELLTEGWQPGEGRTLFLVGDPMQSIYRFREAEVGLFLRARRQGLGTVELEPLNLSANFRSGANLVEWFNGTFSGLLPAAEDVSRGAVPYATATAVHPASAETAATFHPLVGRDDEAEAQQVVTLVREAMLRGDENIAVLVRSRTHLSQILPALRHAGFSYLAQEIDPLAERSIARDLVALTRALLHPADRLAWLSVLRAPWCGLDLSDLLVLCGGDRHASLLELLTDPERMSALSAEGRRRAERVLNVLQHGRNQRGRIGLRRLVEGCWLALGGPASCDGTALEDAERVLSLLESLERGGDLAPLELFEEGLRRLFAAPDTGSDGRLQIMTIHKAKGLQFETVIIPGLGRKPAFGAPPLLRWLEHPQCGLLLAPIAPRDGSGDPIYEAIGRLEKDRESLESARLLYVAATRARRRLHLLGHADVYSGGDLRPASGSLLEKLWPAVVPSFAKVTTADESGSDPVNSPRIVLRRLPVGWEPPLTAAAPVRHAAAPLSPSALETKASETGVEPAQGSTGRAVGTVVHLMLERIAREGVEGWSEARVDALVPEIRCRLQREGVPVALDESQNKVLAALRGALASERGRWLLAPHPEARSEWPLSGLLETGLVHAVVDRTFIDAEGCRWIVDFKSSEPVSSETLEAFCAREGQRYALQLAAYVRLFQLLEPRRRIRSALYFPLCDGWVEQVSVPGGV